MSKKATVIAVVNQKGGTGKTTTCENLGVGLAMEGKKVLVVDTDPQASLTISLGHPVPDDLYPTLSDMMGKIISDQPIAPGEGILHHPEGIDLMPSNIELSGMEVSLVNTMSREKVLKQYLDTVKSNYDFILLDCMVDANLQRESILPSERAFAYKMKLDAIKHQGARSDLTSSQKVHGWSLFLYLKEMEVTVFEGIRCKNHRDLGKDGHGASRIP